MVAAVQFYASPEDENYLVEYLLAGPQRRLLLWEPMRLGDPEYLSWTDARQERTVCVHDLTLGEISLIRPPAKEFSHDSKATIFNRLNWTGFKPRRGEGIVDWATTPAIFWSRGGHEDDMLYVSNVGSQAASMAAVSEEYERWVKRTMAWVRRRGTNVWRWTNAGGESDYDVSDKFANAIYALPGALEHLAAGGRGRRSSHD